MYTYIHFTITTSTKTTTTTTLKKLREKMIKNMWTFLDHEQTRMMKDANNLREKNNNLTILDLLQQN